MVKSEDFVEPWITLMARSETKAVIEGVFQCLPCLWMNYPSNDLACRLKFWQLYVAAQVGLVDSANSCH